MKKRELFVVAVFFVSSMAYAGGNTGCGLGTMIFSQDGLGESDSVLTQILAVTTNGTSWNQTFGITTGTSNCEQPSKWVSNEEVNRFVLANMDNLAKDVAAGQGETLLTLAGMMEVPEERHGRFRSTLQDNFDQIFPSPDVNYAHVVDEIGLIAEDMKG